MRPKGRWVAFAVGLLVLAQCDGASDGEAGQIEEAGVADTSIIAAQEALSSTLMDMPGVWGTAVGLCDGEPCIKVYIERPSPALSDSIPDSYRGFPVDVEVTGEVRARGDTPG